jgi:hypothetical protein
MVKIRRRPSGRGSIPPTSRTSDDWKPEELRPDPVEVLREHTIGQARDVGARCPDDEKDTRNHKKTTDKEADRKAAEKDEKDGKETEARKGTSAEETLIEAIDKRRERSKKYLEGEAKKRTRRTTRKRPRRPRSRRTSRCASRHPRRTLTAPRKSTPPTRSGRRTCR